MNLIGSCGRWSCVRDAAAMLPRCRQGAIEILNRRHVARCGTAAETSCQMFEITEKIPSDPPYIAYAAFPDDQSTMNVRSHDLRA